MFFILIEAFMAFVCLIMAAVFWPEAWQVSIVWGGLAVFAVACCIQMIIQEFMDAWS